jgi:hypothetical protein
MDAGCLSAASVFRKNARKKGEEIDIGAMGLSSATAGRHDQLHKMWYVLITILASKIYYLWERR